MMRRMRRGRVLVALLVLGGSMASAGCTSFAGAGPAPSPTPTATPVAPYGDGILTMATLVPRDGDRALAEMAGLDAVARDAGALAAAGSEDLPPIRVLHRALGSDGASIAAAIADLAARGVDVVFVRGDDQAVAQVLPAAASARMLAANVGAPPDLPGTEDEVARIGAEDPFVADPAAGVTTYRVGVAMLLGAVRAADDGGLSISQALPDVLSGGSECSSPAMCLDVLRHEGSAAYLPVTGSLAH